MFLIHWELIDTLFTRYAIFDSKDEEAIANYKKAIMENITIEDAKQAYLAGLWSGERAKDNISREECAAIVWRAMQKK